MSSPNTSSTAFLTPDEEEAAQALLLLAAGQVQGPSPITTQGTITDPQNPAATRTPSGAPDIEPPIDMTAQPPAAPPTDEQSDSSEEDSGHAKPGKKRTRPKKGDTHPRKRPFGGRSSTIREPGQLDANHFSDVEYRGQMIHTLRRRVQDFAIMDRFQLEAILLRTHWNLDDAEAGFHREAQQARSRHLASEAGRDPLQVDEDALWGSATVHESHRRAVNLVFRRLGAHLPTYAGTPLSFLTIAEVLRDNAWVVNDALRDFHERSLNPNRQRLQAIHERRLRLHTSTRYNQDRRLQVFLEITGTDDHVSARRMLRDHDYDLAVVLNTWMETGLPTIEQPTTAADRRNTHDFIKQHDDNDDLSMGRAVIPGPVTSITAEDDAEARIEYDHHDKSSRKGWPVRHDPIPAHAGMPNPTKFIAEGIRMGKAIKRPDGTFSYGEGKYSRYTMEGVKEAGTGRKGKDGREIGGKVKPFDWSDPSDVSLLNKHYRQPYRRLEPAGSRHRIAARYLPEELRWIEARLEEHMQRNQARGADGTNAGEGQPTSLDMQSLTADFNTAFEGRTDLSGGNQPRPNRLESGISSLIHRTKKWCDKYGLKYFPAHKAKPAPGSKLPPITDSESGDASADEEQTSVTRRTFETIEVPDK